MFRRIIVGLDGSSGSRQALQAAIALARIMKAEIFLVSVMELPHYPGVLDEVEDERNTAQRFFDEIQKDAAQQVTAVGLMAHCEIRAGHAGKVLPQYAQEKKADLLVIGHSGRSGVWGKVLGATADKVVDHASCSVLVVR